MKNIILIIIEILALITSICLGVLWLKYPNCSFDKFTYLTGLIFISTELLRKINLKLIKKEHAKIHINSSNTFFSTLLNDKLGNNKQIVLLFYDLAISNNSNMNFTIKEIKLEYKLNGIVNNVDSIPLLTGTVNSPYYKDGRDSIIVNIPNNKMVLIGWDNLRKKVAENRNLNPGEILRGSAIFGINVETFDDVKEIEDFSIIISDYNGISSKHQIEFQKKWLSMGQNSFINFYEDYSKPI